MSIIVKEYNKLIRDEIPKFMNADGETPVCRFLADDKEFITALLDKFHEELGELEASGDVMELCDILELVCALGETMGYSLNDLILLKEKKAKEKGGFNSRMFCLRTEKLTKEDKAAWPKIK